MDRQPVIPIRSLQILFLFPVLWCLALASGTAQGIRSSTAGFCVEAGPIWQTWSSASYYFGDIDSEAFLGGSLDVAYGFRQRIQVFTGYRFSGSYSASGYDAYRSRAFVLGARTHFGGTLRPLRPWLEAAFAWQTLQLDPISYFDDSGTYLGEFSLVARGPAFQAGIGTRYFITPALALNLGLYGRIGNFTNIRIDGMIDDPDERVDFRFLGVGVGLAYFLN